MKRMHFVRTCCLAIALFTTAAYAEIKTVTLTVSGMT
jgi:hypothetical protein